MLGKIIKYEIKSCSRILLPFLSLAIAASAILRLLLFITPLLWSPIKSYLDAFVGFINFAILLSIFILVFVVLLARFYNSMLATEGYLTFTLPVKVSTLLNGKIIASIGWITLAGIVAFICEKIIFLGYPEYSRNFGIHDMPPNFDMALLAKYRIVFFAFFAVFSLIMAITFLTKIYTAMAIGSQFGKNRILGSVISYFIINTIEGFLSILLVFIPVGFIVGSNSEAIENYFSRFNVSDPYIAMQAIFSFVFIVFGIAILVEIIFTVIQYIITHHIFNKRLNLD